ncbi:EAL domain-containing protein [Azospira restricta]|uniref:EAL domain-containing protein n=1 Tax=Azospira restricta TaxID=404405 RepID=A0A974PXF9_9RHOO|nr:EAL domain-containing protein [Azospira restricta]QRJ63136.1 EAL domain-containing protein [Azospira restricta]
MSAVLPQAAWNARLATGLSMLDRENRQLLDMLATLADLHRRRAEPRRIRESLQELRSYAGHHFWLEEELMAAWPVSPENKAAHLRAHTSFARCLHKAEAMLGECTDDAVDHLLAFLGKWLVQHIGVVDARLARELAALGMPLPALPSASAEGDAGHDTLINTVSELYDSISVRTLEVLDTNRRLLHQMRERERTEAALRASEARYRALADNGQALIWMAGVGGDAEFFNRPWLRFTGRSAEQETGHGWLEGVHPDDLARCQAALDAALARQEKFNIVCRLRRHDGAYRWLVCEGAPRYDGDGGFAGYVGHGLDITEHRAAAAQQQLAAQVVDTMGEAVMITDPAGRIERVNAAFTRITGYAGAEVAGALPQVLGALRDDDVFAAGLWRDLQAQGSWLGEVSGRMRDGERRPLWLRITALRDEDGAVSHYVAVLSDLSEVRRAQELAEQLSWRDPLTGLGNRSLFGERLTQALAASHRDGTASCVLLLDIDRFKLLNEARGITVGDTVLLSIASSLVDTLGDDDLVARLDADEFAILLGPRAHDRQELAAAALRTAEKLRSRLYGGIDIHDGKLRVECSIGIALFPEAGADTAMDVLRQADLAMHQAKAGGGGRVKFFESRMGDAVRDRYELEQELRQAIEAGELRLYLQTQIGPDKTPVGAEALVRWEHPRRGLVPPASFVPVAEGCNLVGVLDRWVLTEACRLLARLDAGGRPLRISVNISPQHFQEPDFVERVAEILRQTGADGSHLVLEVTEGLVIGNVDEVVARMLRLQDLGIRFSLDDFGTGYSSLSYLKRLPIHELKIDRGFIRDVTTDANDAALVDTILAVARLMELQVVAEGVETRAQADYLDTRYPMVHQGYLYARPQEANAWFSAFRG